MHIYLMRSNGYRLTSRAALGTGVHGWLEFKQTPPDSWGPRWEAHLRDGKGGRDLITPLQWARIRRIDGVLHLAGREECGRPNTKAKSQLRRQSWLCALSPDDAAPLLARVWLPPVAGFPANDEEELDLPIPLD